MCKEKFDRHEDLPDYSQDSSIEVYCAVVYLCKIGERKDAVIDDMLKTIEYNEAQDILVKSEQNLLKKDVNFMKLKSSLNLFDDENGFMR